MSNQEIDESVGSAEGRAGGDAREERNPPPKVADSIWGATVGLVALLFLFIPVQPLAPPSRAGDGEERGLRQTEAVIEELGAGERDGERDGEEPSSSNLGAGFGRGDFSAGGGAPPIRASSFVIAVKGPNGAPVEGANVDLMGSAIDSALRFESDARGLVETPKLPAGFYELYAHDGLLVSRPLLGVQLRDDEPKEAELILRPGVVFHGEVLRLRDDAPIADAKITISPDTLSLMRREVRTDAFGRFRAEGLHEGESTIHVEAEGYTREGPLRISPAEGALTIHLGLASSLKVSVRDAQGRPIEEAEILVLVDAEEQPPAVIAGERLSVLPGPVPPIPPAPLSGEPGRSGDGARLSILASGETDRSGELLLSGLPPTKIKLRAEADGSTPALSDELELIPGQQISSSLTLHEGGSLALLVLSEDGSPLGGARVRAETGDDPFAFEALTDEQGEVVLYSLEGEYTVTAFAGELESPALRLRIPRGERIEATLAFEERTSRLSGRVVDARGFGISGARIMLRSKGMGRRFERDLSAARDGTFAFESIPPPPYALRIEHPAYPGLEIGAIERGGELSPITLARGGALRGQLVDDRSGAGIRATIAITIDDQRFQTRSDNDGAFTADQLPLGRAEIRIEAEGYLALTRELAVDSQERAVSLGTIRLERAATLRGELRDRYGEPVYGAELSLEGLSDAIVKSDEAGRFVLTGLPAGRARLIATLRDGTRHAYRGALQLRSGEIFDGLDFRLAHYEEPRPDLPAAQTFRVGVPIEVADEGGAIAIQWIAEESEAARAGLRVGDRIAGVNGEPLLIAAQARAALRVGEGERITLRILREGAPPRLVRLNGERYAAP